MAAKKTSKKRPGESGKLRIGDHWNAITIIALSQNNPLKAIAEFVENSIDANARSISIVRGRRQGEHYLKVIDDGDGIPDFQYVATHIGDSIKRRLKNEGATGIQGEFGIGLLSFWTVGDELTLTSVDETGTGKIMRLVKGNPTYSVRNSSTLFDRAGTELTIQPLLSGVRMLSGEKMQAYLASELRDRIAKSGVSIRIVDRTARKEFVVEPRKFGGRLMHNLPIVRSPLGEVYVELYLAENSSDTTVGLYKSGTRVVPDVTRIDSFDHSPWSSRYVEGIVDADFIQLTPGTRDGVVFDAAFTSLVESLRPVEDAVAAVIAEHKKAEEEEASRSIMKKVTKALREAFLMLPRDEYGWLSAQTRGGKTEGKGTGPGSTRPSGGFAGEDDGVPTTADTTDGVSGEISGSADQVGEKKFFEFPGPLFRLTIAPSSSTIGVGKSKRLHAIPRDKSRRVIDGDVDIAWIVTQGAGTLSTESGEFVEYTAPDEPELAIVEAQAVQGETECTAQAMITVTAELIPTSAGSESAFRHGLPGYTYRPAAGELWRSTYDPAESLIVINNAHADFVYAARNASTKLRYIARLYAKEIVIANFPEANKTELLERLVELLLYMEENLR